MISRAIGVLPSIRRNSTAGALPSIMPATARVFKPVSIKISSTGSTRIVMTVANLGSLASSMIASVLKKAFDKGILNFLPAYRPNR
ncbi:Uncharacterised protein [Vibrio cholerae]|nr:Uncharacterised protein [Vibrio cholerae]